MKGCDDLTVDSDGTLLAFINNKIIRYANDGDSMPTWGGQTDNGGIFGKLSKFFSGSTEDEDSDPNLYLLKNRPSK